MIQWLLMSYILLTRFKKNNKCKHLHEQDTVVAHVIHIADTLQEK